VQFNSYIRMKPNDKFLSCSISKSNIIFMFTYKYWRIRILGLSRICLTSWSRVLKKLTVTHLINKFPAFYGTRRFITVLTRVRH
jgi:hypothetical protein